MRVTGRAMRRITSSPSPSSDSPPLPSQPLPEAFSQASVLQSHPDAADEAPKAPIHDYRLRRQRWTPQAPLTSSQEARRLAHPNEYLTQRERLHEENRRMQDRLDDALEVGSEFSGSQSQQSVASENSSHSGSQGPYNSEVATLSGNRTSQSRGTTPQRSVFHGDEDAEMSDEDEEAAYGSSQPNSSQARRSTVCFPATKLDAKKLRQIKAAYDATHGNISPHTVKTVIAVLFELEDERDVDRAHQFGIDHEREWDEWDESFLVYIAREEWSNL